SSPDKPHSTHFDAVSTHHQTGEEWNHETTQHSPSGIPLRALDLHLTRSEDAKVPATEIDGTGKAVTRHTQASEAPTADSECGGTAVARDQERPIALQGGKTTEAPGGTRPVNPSDKSDPDTRAIPTITSSPSATTGAAHGGCYARDKDS